MSVPGEHQFAPPPTLTPAMLHDYTLTPAMLHDYTTLGYILLRNFLTPDEVCKARRVFDETDIIAEYGYGLPDAAGRMPRMVLWNSPGHDVTGMVCRCEKVVHTAEQLLGGEVYHYHSKMMLKEARVGGKVEWHQDYGYWYQNGLLTPDALSVLIPLDECRKDNGCLQVVAGSHKCGKIEHVMRAGQTGADLGRVSQILADTTGRFQHLFVEMSPGDALFFHSNVLHMSEPNDSDTIRRVLILAYNRADNSPESKEVAGHHPMYSPIERVPDSAIMECQNFTDFTGKDFLSPENDKTVRAAK